MSFLQDGQQLSCVNCAAVFHSVLDAAEHTITCKVPVHKGKELKDGEILDEATGNATYEVIEAQGTIQEPSMPMVTSEMPKPPGGFIQKEISLEDSARESPYFSSNEKARWTRGVIANLLTLMKAHVNDLGRARARGGSRAAAPVWIEICEAMQEKVGPWVTRAKIMVKWQTLVDKSKKYDEETEKRKIKGLPPTLAPDFHTIIKDIDKGIKTAMVTNLLEEDDDEDEEDEGMGGKPGDTSSSSKGGQDDMSHDFEQQPQPVIGEDSKDLDDEDSSPEYNPEDDDSDNSEDINLSNKKEIKKPQTTPMKKVVAPVAIEADGVTLSRDTTIKIFNYIEMDGREVSDVAKEFGMSVAVLDTLQKNRGAVLAGCHECKMCGLVLANKEEGNSHELKCAIKNKSMDAGRSITRDYSFHFYPITIRHLCRLVTSGDTDKPNWPSITKELSVHQDGLSIERCSQKWRNLVVLTRNYHDAVNEAKKKNKVVTKQQPEFYKMILPHVKDKPLMDMAASRSNNRSNNNTARSHYQRKIDNMKNNDEDLYADDPPDPPPNKRIKMEPGATNVGPDVIKRQQDHITSLEKKLDNVVRLLKEVSDENKRMAVEVKKKDYEPRKANLDAQNKTFQSSVGLKLDQMARLHHQMHDENIQHIQTIIGMFERHHQENTMVMRNLVGEISQWRTGDKASSNSGNLMCVEERDSGRKRKVGVISMPKDIVSESSTSKDKEPKTKGDKDENETEIILEKDDTRNKTDKDTIEDKDQSDTSSKSTMLTLRKTLEEDSDKRNKNDLNDSLEKKIEEILNEESSSHENKIEDVLNGESSSQEKKITLNRGGFSPKIKDSDKIEDLDTGAPVPASPRKSTRSDNIEDMDTGAPVPMSPRKSSRKT